MPRRLHAALSVPPAQIQPFSALDLGLGHGIADLQSKSDTFSNPFLVQYLGTYDLHDEVVFDFPSSREPLNSSMLKG